MTPSSGQPNRTKTRGKFVCLVSRAPRTLPTRTISFEELGPGLYGYTAEGDPNSGVVVGENSVLVVDAQATPAMARDVIARIRTVTDKPVKHVVLSHYHAVRVLGASGYEGAEIIASDVTRDMVVERGQQDMDSEIGRFPRLFRGKESIPGLTWPDITFHKQMTLWMGKREVQIIHIGRATRQATRWSGCRRSGCCSRATRSSSAPHPIAATRTSPTGPAQWTRSAR